MSHQLIYSELTQAKETDPMNRFLSILNRILKNLRFLRRWRRVVMFLASVCVFVTTYNLILPAISVDKNNVGNVSGLYLDDADSTNDDQDTPDEPVSDGITIQEPKIHMQKTPNSN
jgi:hypothetical protein